MAEDQEGRGFTVRDRRTFSPGQEEAPAGERPAERAEAGPESPKPPPRPSARDVPLPEPTFPAFLTFFFFQQALMFLGELPHPETAQTERNLPMAKYLIDTLGMIKEKTQGNLTSEEQGHLETFLAELRLRYVKAAKG